MKALRFERKPARFAAAALAGRVVPGGGASFGPLRLADVDLPELPGSDWMRLRPRLAGICGSDLATIDGRSSRYFEPIVSFPFTPGHEVVGDLDDDTRAVLVPILACATRGIEPPCPGCAAGQINRCERIAFGHLEPGLQTGFCADTGGGWSTALIAHESQILPVPAAMPDDQAVMVEPAACAVHAARSIGRAGTVAVIGSGTLGLLVISALRAYADVTTIIATAKYPHQRALATELGADWVAAPAELARSLRSATGSFVVGGRPTGGADVVVDCVGTSDTIAQAIAVSRPGGQVVLVGMPGHTSLDLTPLWHRETVLRGCYAYTIDDFEAALGLVAEAGLGRLVSATYPLARFTEAVEHAANAGRRRAVKIAFDLRNEKERNR